MAFVRNTIPHSRRSPRPIGSGTRTRDEGETWISWWLLPATLTDDQVADFIDDNDITEYYNGPGRPFERRPNVRRSRSYVLITQAGGYDI